MSNTALAFISIMLIGSVMTTAFKVIQQTPQMKQGIVSYVMYEHQKTAYKPDVKVQLISKR